MLNYFKNIKLLHFCDDKFTFYMYIYIILKCIIIFIFMCTVCVKWLSWCFVSGLFSLSPLCSPTFIFISKDFIFILAENTINRLVFTIVYVCVCVCVIISSLMFFLHVRALNVRTLSEQFSTVIELPVNVLISYALIIFPTCNFSPRFVGYLARRLHQIPLLCRDRKIIIDENVKVSPAWPERDATDKL